MARRGVRFRGLYEKTYLKAFPNYPDELAKAVGECRTLLDVGCGSNSPIRVVPNKVYKVGVDAFGQSIKRSKEKNIHNKYVQMDVLDIGKSFKPHSFDCVVASNLIEHLTKEDGMKLIVMMEQIAKKRVIIYTPNGFLPQGEYDDNPWQLHKSGWTAKEMRNMGFAVTGIHGWKPLRGKHASIRFWPRPFWRVVSDLTQPIVRKMPEKAFQILCVKNLHYFPGVLRPVHNRKGTAGGGRAQ